MKNYTNYRLWSLVVSLALLGIFCSCSGTLGVNPKSLGLDAPEFRPEKPDYWVLPNGSITDVEPIGLIPCNAFFNCKPILHSWFFDITDDQKNIFTPPDNVNRLMVVVNDTDNCNYIRVSMNCPTGTIGCTLIAPFHSLKTINLPDNYAITEVCVEVVEKSNTDVKSWNVISPTKNIEVIIDGLSPQ